MKALVKTKYGENCMQYMDVPEPVTGAGQLKVRIFACGICGTDIHLMHDTYPSNPPIITGHEFSGTVVEVGEGVTGFRVGDKVMQIKNNYQLEWEVRTKYGIAVDKGQGVFNGDMGIVTEINTFDRTVEVEYDEHRRINYPFELTEELELAYAITVHKSQGSEYPAVIIPLLQGPKLLYNRNLLYTAVTRAKKCLTIVGSEDVFQYMIQNKSEQNRYTSLAEHIQEF